MRKKVLTAVLATAMTAALLAGCGKKEETTATTAATTTEAATEAKETEAEKTYDDGTIDEVIHKEFPIMGYKNTKSSKI